MTRRFTPAAARLNRRSVLLGAATAAIGGFTRAHSMETAERASPVRQDNDKRDVLTSRVHEGKGKIDVKFFRFDGAARPAVLLIYTIPPGSSEGVHVHQPGDARLGSYDEFYYIMSGSGVMQIAGEMVAVKAGDHVFTPNGVEHGIENTASDADLKVYLVAVIRE